MVVDDLTESHISDWKQVGKMTVVVLKDSQDMPIRPAKINAVPVDSALWLTPEQQQITECQASFAGYKPHDLRDPFLKRRSPKSRKMRPILGINSKIDHSRRPIKLTMKATLYESFLRLSRHNISILRKRIKRGCPLAMVVMTIVERDATVINRNAVRTVRNVNNVPI